LPSRELRFSSARRTNGRQTKLPPRRIDLPPSVVFR
jgi:hypothetical protein